MKDEIKEILDNFKDYELKYTQCNENRFIIFYRDIHILLDYITNLQEENTKKDNIINDIEEFIKYLDRETNVYLVNTAYTVILGKLKKLKIDNGLLQGSDKE